ncbi:GYF domain-containing protein [Rubritalea sp.]|uniref:DUF4339 domain-containing protein n=1 Tax=Rubritalea sp. TaxID=2109375 RepID=UPI003EF61525
MWYYTLNGKQAGPISQDELTHKLTGQLPADTLVWKEGMSEWLTASSIPDFSQTQPPSPAHSNSAPQEPKASSDTNPYASPTSNVLDQTIVNEVTELPAEPVQLDVGFCIKQGWKHTMRNFGLVFLTGFVYLIVIVVISGLFSAIGSAIDGPQTAPEINYESMEASDAFFASIEAENQTGPVGSLLEIVSNIFQAFLAMGLTAFALTHVRGGEASVGQLFTQSGSKLLKVIGATILYYLAIFVGTIFLIIPGIYIAIRYMYYQIAIVDKDLGVMESFKYSSELTRQNKWRIIGLGLINFLIIMAGMMALFIGLIWAIPVVILAHTISYCYLHSGKRSIAVQS